MLGVAVFAVQFPSFLFSLFGGIVADRYNRFKVLLITQVISMVQAVSLTLLVLFTRYTVFEILALSTILGIVNAFDLPARQSLVQDMVKNKEDLGNAIALNSSMNNLARLIGPAISGIILAKLGAGICFMMNALSFTAVIATLLMMKLPSNMQEIRSRKIMEGLRDGLKYLTSTPSIGRFILLIGLCSLTIIPYITLLPVIARMTLNGNAATYGYLNSVTGIGAICGAVFLASVKPHINLGKILVIILFVLGAGLVLLSHTHNLFFALLFATITGFGIMSLATIINTLLQTTSSPEMRGRVISFFAMAYFGMQPLGSLLIGGISNYAGTQATILSQGIAAFVIALVFFPFLWKGIRPHSF